MQKSSARHTIWPGNMKDIVADPIDKSRLLAFGEIQIYIKEAKHSVLLV